MVEIETKSLVAALSTPTSLFGLLLLVGALAVYRFILFSPDLSHIPLLDAELPQAERWRRYKYENNQLYARGYEKFKRIYRIDTPEGDLVVVPNHMIEEVNQKDVDMNKLQALNDQTETEVTGIVGVTLMMNHLIKSDITSSLNRNSLRLARTTQQVVAAEFGSCPDWTQMTLYPKLLNCVALNVAEMLVGPKLARNPEFLEIALPYVNGAFTAVFALRLWPKQLRPIGRYFTPEVKHMNELLRRMRKFLKPVIRERKIKWSKNEDLSDDLLTWAIKKEAKWPGDIQSDDDLSTLIMTICMAAMHTTSNTVYAFVKDMLTYPGLVQTLRSEIEEVLAKHDGMPTVKALYEMRLLDSAMKESQRLHSMGPLLYHNKTRNGVTFSDGTYVPPNISCSTVSQAPQVDPALWENPTTFDPYRFLKMREASDEAGKYQFVTIGPNMLSFGYGKHACPGRFFATNIMKNIIVSIVTNYDVETKKLMVDENGNPEVFFKKVAV